jgi:hypothetical protein
MLELALDAAPIATASYIQYRLLRPSVTSLTSSTRSGWLCALLPWACR